MGLGSRTPRPPRARDELANGGSKPGFANLRELCERFATPGRIEAVFLRPVRRQPAVSVGEAVAEPGRGLVGDHRAERVRTGEPERRRELTLFQHEHLAGIAQWCGSGTIEPSRLRRNLVVSGANLVAMRSPFPDVSLEWSLGEQVRIEVTGRCDPCSRMEEELGFGGYNALRGHGGVTARILAGGTLRVGDAVRFVGVRRRAEAAEGVGVGTL